MFTSCAEVKRLVKEENAQLIDVRTPEEFAMSQIPGSVNVPLHELEMTADKKIRKDTPVVVFCRSGARSQMGMQLLKSMGYSRVYNLGSFMSWNQC